MVGVEPHLPVRTVQHRVRDAKAVEREPALTTALTLLNAFVNDSVSSTQLHLGKPTEGSQVPPSWDPSLASPRRIGRATGGLPTRCFLSDMLVKPTPPIRWLLPQDASMFTSGPA